MLQVGESLQIEAQITDDMVRKFAEVSGDFNPMHVDDAYAANTRFKRRIAHGMLSAALISRALGQHLGPGGIYLAQTLKFLQPVFIDETVIITLNVTAYRKERGIGTIETLVKKKETGETCVKGEATIMTADHV